MSNRSWMSRGCWIGLWIVGAFASTAHAQKIYWSDSGRIGVGRANLDGSDVEILVKYSSGTGLALDPGAGKMYRPEEAPPNPLVRRNLDGTNAETLLTNPATTSLSIALDIDHGKVYWASEENDHKIRRANFDGSGIEIIQSGVDDARGIAIDTMNGKVYWTQSKGFFPDPQARIRRANLNGTGAENVIVTGGVPVGIALDINGGKMYWADYSDRKVRCAALDGSGVQVLLDRGDRRPYAITLDSENRKMYWSETRMVSPQTYSHIIRADFDGANVEEILDAGPGSISGIALDLSCQGVINGTPCNDGDPCTSGDHCLDGSCAGNFNSDSCDDEDDCTLNDRCVQGECVGEPDVAGCARFFLQITEVNGVPCPSCPTDALPLGEILPGDTVTVDVFLANWDHDPNNGFCQNGPACTVSAQNCVGRHCSLTGSPCTNNLDCFTGQSCVPNSCVPYPQPFVVQWTIDSESFESGAAGELFAQGVDCATDIDCRHGLTPEQSCTCAGSTCSGGICDLDSIAFIDQSRPDYVFSGFQTIAAASFSSPDFEVGATTLLSHGPADTGAAVYTGTLILTSSLTARGTFTLQLLDHIGLTFIIADLHNYYQAVLPRTILPATIHFCDVLSSPNDCNNNTIPDECEKDADQDGLIDDCDPCPTDARNDTDDDGVCDVDDGCPDDPDKTAPGFCGCGTSDSADSDADGVSDCVDACPGVDDALFAPGCASAIPAASGWGLVALALLFCMAYKLQRWSAPERPTAG